MTPSKPNRLPLYKQVTLQLREQCFASSGEMLPSLRQLSQKFEVNHATISRALRELEEEGLVEIVPRKGIFSVSRPEAQPNIELVVLVSEKTNLLDVASRIAEGMRRTCEDARTGLPAVTVSRSVLSVPPMPDAERFVAELRARGTVGAVFLGFGFFSGEEADREEEFISEVAQRLPLVLAGGPHDSLHLDCVYGDPHLQLEEFLEACHDEGFRDFEYLGDRGDNFLQRARRANFQEFMTSKGLAWTWNPLRTGDTSELALHLRSLPKLPEVVVATNVSRALTIALEAQRRGLNLPRDLRILCFASLLEHAQPLFPYATVVMLDEPEVGARAVEVLQERLRVGTESPLRTERVPAQFISGPLAEVNASAAALTT